ncbi:DinB family protein [Candidatus Sumerlaeota bacterium]|nr:DinB family protein [Candidatus Sumerlaeota bacterium]
MEFELAKGSEILERTPRVLRALLEGLADEWSEATEGGESWSAYVIVGHLLHGEHDNWMPRAEMILAQGADRRFHPFDRLAQFRECQGKSLRQLLDEFEHQRAANLAKLKGWNLTAAQLALEGEHPAFGTVTLRQLLATWVAHDLGHVAQITRVMAKQYRGAVGPWRAYLPIMEK